MAAAALPTQFRSGVGPGGAGRRYRISITLEQIPADSKEYVMRTRSLGTRIG